MQVSDSLGENGKSIFERALSLVEELLSGTTEADCTSSPCGDTGEADEAVLHLLEDIGVARLDARNRLQRLGIRLLEG